MTIPVTIRDRKVYVGDIPVPLLSGEMHYWRLDPHNWRPILQRVKQLGLQVVATYACWDFHELSPGQLDFTGETDPRRNLVGFLEMLTEEGFWIIFRPGPYIYSEWRNNGVPDDAARVHRLDAYFLDRAGHYVEAVTAAAAPFLATRGGRILVWQADNEIDPWPHLYTEPLGLGALAGVFQEFLRERYENIDALNHAWRGAYRSFAEARAVTSLVDDDPATVSRYLDVRRFMHDYVNRVAAWAVEAYRAQGVDVPILLNTYSGVGVQNWASLEQIGDLVGPDIYPSREYRFRTLEQPHILEAGRYTRCYSRLPYIPEYEVGIWHDWLDEVGVLPPNHYRLTTLTALQGGVVGWNWYMLVNRDNWYQSPINEWGRTRPELFDVFCQLTALYRELDPASLQPQTETAVTFHPLQHAARQHSQQMLHSLYHADIDYDFFDLTGEDTEKRFLLYAGGRWLPSDAHQRLIAYVERGGHLVFCGTAPELDEQLFPHHPLGLPPRDGVIGGLTGQLRLNMLNSVLDAPWVHRYADPLGEPIIAVREPASPAPSEELSLQFSLPVGSTYAVGYTVERGAGRITMIGMPPSPALLLALHDYFDIPLSCRSKTPGVTSALFRRGQEYVVIATNVGSEHKSAELALSASLLSEGDWRTEDLLTGHPVSFDRQANTVYLPIASKDGTAARIFRSS